MNPQEDDFNAVRGLLRCKRYEQPPPGYFLSFSDKVLARIEAEETAEYSSWWAWFVARFDARPILVCAYGLTVSGLLLMGFRISQAFEAEMATAPTMAGPWLAATPSSPNYDSESPAEESFVQPVPSSLLANSMLGYREEASHLFFRRSFPLQRAGLTLNAP